MGFYSAGELRGELRFLLQLPRAPQLSLGPGCLGSLPIGALGPWVSSGLPFVPLVLVMAWWPNCGCGPSVLGPPLLQKLPPVRLRLPQISRIHRRPQRVRAWGQRSTPAPTSRVSVDQIEPQIKVNTFTFCSERNKTTPLPLAPLRVVVAAPSTPPHPCWDLKPPWRPPSETSGRPAAPTRKYRHDMRPYSYSSRDLLQHARVPALLQPGHTSSELSELLTPRLLHPLIGRWYRASHSLHVATPALGGGRVSCPISFIEPPSS